MQIAAPSLPVTVHRQDWRSWMFLITAVVLIASIFGESLIRLVGLWETQPEYSFGYLIPFISVFLVWQRKSELSRLNFEGSWWGPGLLAFALMLWALGRISTLDTLAHYAFVLVVVGVVLGYVGRPVMRYLGVALFMLVFMVPLPNYLLRELSGALQLLSSRLGVEFIRWFGVSVYLEGNVIDLGSMKLQVVEACDGLRYLFPLMTLGFIAAYFYRASFWKRAVVFLSTIPISVLMNSFRIGVIGVTVDRWGRGMAEGLLHDLEGWVVFMLCTALLILEVWVLSKLTSSGQRLRDVFLLDFPEPSPKGASVQYRTLPRPSYATLAILALATLAAYAIPNAEQIVPKRRSLDAFPLKLESWTGRPEQLSKIYLDQLQLTDYMLATYADPQQHLVNLYVSYYDTQSKGNSAHSPRDCMPGDGWEINSLEKYELPKLNATASPLIVNRAVIRKGETAQLVYYWFQQRGRIIAGEYRVKLYLFWDMVTRHRSDGAMVRLVTPLGRNEPVEVADARLHEFTRTAFPQLRVFIPE